MIQSALLIGLGAVGMWAFRKITGGVIGGPLHKGRRIKGVQKMKQLPAGRRFSVIKNHDGNFEVIALPYAFGNHEKVGVLRFKATPYGRFLIAQGKGATPRMFLAAMLEHHIKRPS